jgi:beta-N-acetylhexosaminidase
MDAIPDVEEGVVRSLAAGVDVVMACHTCDKHVGPINKVYKAVEGGRLDLETLKEGGRRIARMKNKSVGEWKDVLDKDDEQMFDEEWPALKQVNVGLSMKAY